MRKGITIILLGLFTLCSIGIAAMVCPRGYTEPNETVARLEETLQDTSTLDRHRDLARWYNLNLISKDPDPGFSEAYGEILDLEAGAMGILSVPSMGIRIPIYHGADKGRADAAGHFADTPFPLGPDGASSAFRVPFFLEKGAYFYIHCLDTTAAYRIENKSLQLGRQPEFDGGEGKCSLVVPLGAAVIRMEGIYAADAPGEGEIVVRTEENSDGFTLAMCLLLALGIVLVPLLTRWGK